MSGEAKHFLKMQIPWVKLSGKAFQGCREKKWKGSVQTFVPPEVGETCVHCSVLSDDRFKSMQHFFSNSVKAVSWKHVLPC